jgi:hypothetical protein
MPLKPSDVVQVKFPIWCDWVAYVWAAVPSLLHGRECDYLVRFAHRWTGLFRFFEFDLSETEGMEPWPMPLSQTQGMMTQRVVYPSDYGLPPPWPEPEPPPEPEPQPEPQPESDVTIATVTVPGMPLIFGNWGEAGIPIMLVGAGGNIQQVLTGSKLEHGPGGFEFLVYGKGLHLLSIASYQFEVWVIEDGRAVKVLFNKDGQQEEMVRLVSKVAIDKSLAERIIERYPGCGFAMEML